MATITSMQISHAQHAGVRGGVCSQVLFERTDLTESELEYVRLVARTNFFQLIRTVVYMNEGMNFRQATTKYFAEVRKANTNGTH